VGMVLGPEARSALTRATRGKADCIGAVDIPPAVRQERNHLPVADGVCSSIERSSDQEEGAVISGRRPARPWTLHVAKTFSPFQMRKKISIEAECTRKVGDTDEDVGNHLHLQEQWRLLHEIPCVLHE
jgi:hypothetical protein